MFNINNGIAKFILPLLVMLTLGNLSGCSVSSDGKDGIDGADGADGADGMDGTDGYMDGPDTVEVQLLAINDYHGHITTSALPYGETRGGGEYLSTKLKELRQGKPYSLTVAAGDLIGGSPAFSGLFHDEPSVESLNAMGMYISSVGNHEFDEGVTELLRMQEGGCHPVDGCYFAEEYAGADFTWLAANVVSEADGATTPLPAYTIEEFEGVKVAFIGMTLEATDELVAAAGITGWEFLDEAETANNLVPILADEGVEAIVVLLHEGAQQNPPPGDINSCEDVSGPVLAINDALDPEIDVLITGHTHLPYNCLIPDAEGNNRIVTSAYSYGRVVSEINLVLDKTTNDVDRTYSNATNHAVYYSNDGYNLALTPDPAITAIIEKWQPKYDEINAETVGTITEDILRGGTSGSDRGVESPAGNLVADAQLWATEELGAEIAFMNPGGVRTDLTYAQSEAEGDGVVTYGEAFSFQPFNNTLFTFEMTGEQIQMVLEEQCQPTGSSRPILHLGVSEGFTYDLETTVVDGDCTAITVSNMKLDGGDIELTGTYMVTANNFLADGGDNFETFATVTTTRLDGGIDLEALNAYLLANSPVSAPSTDRVNEL